jgi:hypothetical protein
MSSARRGAWRNSSAKTELSVCTVQGRVRGLNGNCTVGWNIWAALSLTVFDIKAFSNGCKIADKLKLQAPVKYKRR